MNAVRIKKVNNGYVLVKDTYEGDMNFTINEEYVFESLPKLYKFLKDNMSL